MAKHRVTCAVHVTIYEPHEHSQIAIVRTGEPESRKWTLPQLCSALDAGDHFYTHVDNDAWKCGDRVLHVRALRR